MVEKTGTVWEKDDLDQPTDSCNQGFASVVAVILLKCLIGYKSVTDGKLICDTEHRQKGKEYGLTFSFTYGKNKYEVNC